LGSLPRVTPRLSSVIDRLWSAVVTGGKPSPLHSTKESHNRRLVDVLSTAQSPLEPGALAAQQPILGGVGGRCERPSTNGDLERARGGVERADPVEPKLPSGSDAGQRPYHAH
jgi:hypothetical protein